MKQELIDQDMIIVEDEDENKQTFRNTTTTSNQDMLHKQLEKNQERDSTSADILVGGCIKAKEFEEIAEVYDQIRQWNEDLQMKSCVDDYQLAMMFDQELKNVMHNINMIQNQTQTPVAREEGLDFKIEEAKSQNITCRQLETKQRCVECLQ